MAKGEKEVAPLYAKFTAMSAQDMARDPQAMAIGERLFMNNCAQCHGTTHPHREWPANCLWRAFAQAG